MRRFLPFALAGLFAGTAAALSHRQVIPSPGGGLATRNDPSPTASGEPLVQIALLLDTSNSMDGLINQAKRQMFDVANAFITAKRGGVAPRLEVALYEYGNDSIPRENGFVRQVLPFTSDLDLLSEKLFSLVTNGGEEYCGQVIQTATRDLPWSPRADALKLIFVAGNEPFTQGSIDFHGSIRTAAEKGIKVSTLYCGSDRDGDAVSWREGAEVARGHFFAIEQDRMAVEPPAPQDAEMNRLTRELNTTYVPYGPKGAESQARQQWATQNAVSNGLVGYAPERGNRYSYADHWDLVDAHQSGKDRTVAKADLPPELQAKTEAERETFLNQQLARRKELQDRINVLWAERNQFQASWRAQHHGDPTLGAAIVAAVREEAAQKHFVFD